MIVITTDHAAHDPNRFTVPTDTRPYSEVPARADTLLATLRAAGIGSEPAKDHGLAPIAHIHDAGYLVERLGLNLTAFLTGMGVL